MVKTDEKKQLFYNNIVRESMRLSRLVDDLMELSRLQSGTEAIQKSEFDLQEVFNNIKDLYGPLAEQANVKLLITDWIAGQARNDADDSIINDAIVSNKVASLRSGPAPGYDPGSRNPALNEA
jgi:signal transduction histidine kinase